MGVNGCFPLALARDGLSKKEKNKTTSASVAKTSKGASNRTATSSLPETFPGDSGSRAPCHSLLKYGVGQCGGSRSGHSRQKPRQAQGERSTGSTGLFGQNWDLCQFCGWWTFAALSLGGLWTFPVNCPMAPTHTHDLSVSTQLPLVCLKCTQETATSRLIMLTQFIHSGKTHLSE